MQLVNTLSVEKSLEERDFFIKFWVVKSEMQPISLQIHHATTFLNMAQLKPRECIIHERMPTKSYLELSAMGEALPFATFEEAAPDASTGV